jgi:hypothetical protein
VGDLKDFLDRIADKRNELARKAVKKAARSAIDSAGKAIGRVLFGNLDDDETKPAEEQKPDPFAKLKAAEAEKREREREEKRSAKK